ncbi:MAG: hypothetical protein Q8R12_02680 [bacterium]|nr:hypothetical protein [bacterium]
MKGFSLLETLVAVGILIGAVLGPLSLASSSINAASLAKNQIIAANLAAEAMEVARNKRDSNIFQGVDWLSGFSSCLEPGFCFLDMSQISPYDYEIGSCAPDCPALKRNPANGLFNVGTGEETGFVRKITMASLASGEVRVRVEVSWKEKNSTPSFVLETYLFRWH